MTPKVFPPPDLFHCIGPTNFEFDKIEVFKIKNFLILRKFRVCEDFEQSMRISLKNSKKIVENFEEIRANFEKFPKKFCRKNFLKLTFVRILKRINKILGQFVRLKYVLKILENLTKLCKLKKVVKTCYLLRKCFLNFRKILKNLKYVNKFEK